MKRLLCAVLVVAWAVPASAGPITWAASDVITAVWDPFHRLPGLTVGTPWSVQLTFNPDVPANPLRTDASWGCNYYNVGATAAFQLGGFNYTATGGRVFTNSIIPVDNCRDTAPSLSPPGLVQFIFGGLSSVDAGAWNLNSGPRISMFNYYDLVHQDGSLPLSPTVGPLGTFSGLEFESDLFEIRSRFEPHLVEQPTAVPEPATLTMFGAGLALLARRRLRKPASRD